MGSFHYVYYLLAEGIFLGGGEWGRVNTSPSKLLFQLEKVSGELLSFPLKLLKMTYPLVGHR